MNLEIPRYNTISPQFLDLGEGPCFIPEDEVIEWEGEPNLDMEPLNEAAHEAMDRFFAKMESGKPKKHEDSIYEGYATRPREEMKYPKRDDNVPMMANDRKARSRIRRANADQPKARILEKGPQERVKKVKRVMTGVDAKITDYPDQV